jgi:septum formation protein
MLKEAGISFIQSTQDFDEDSIDSKIPELFVYKAALGKLFSAESLYGLDTPLLCADTVISVEGKIIRKPTSKDEARELLLNQSGSKVDIITATLYKDRCKTLYDLSQTSYLFYEFDRDELELFLDSGEWRGKAGGCMVEGFCKKYIRSSIGLESSALGLSLEKILPFLGE